MQTLDWVRIGLVAAVLLFVLQVLFESNVRRLLEEHGWDTLLTRAVTKVRQRRGFWFVFGIVIGAGAMAWVLPWVLPSNALLFDSSVKLKQISGHTFVNQTVELDGNEYMNCTFENVTFVYNGTAPTKFIDSIFIKEGKFRLVSTGPAVKQTMVVLDMLDTVANGNSRIFHLPDDGTLVPAKQ